MCIFISMTKLFVTRKINQIIYQWEKTILNYQDQMIAFYLTFANFSHLGSFSSTVEL